MTRRRECTPVDEARDIVLFLGAGFSCAAGLPCMAQFGHVSEEEADEFVRKHGPQSRHARNSFPLLHGAAEAFRGFSRFCERAASGVSLDVGNMETVFCIAEALEEAGGHPVAVNGAERPPKDIIHQIQWWLWHIYNMARFIDQSRPGGPYRRFAKEFLPYGKRLCVLTTNYDIVFEYFAWREGRKCNYALDGLLDPHGRGPLGREHELALPLFDPTESYVDVVAGNSPIVCKLHGSVNFYQYEVASGHRVFGVSNDIAPVQARRIGESWISQDIPAVFPLDSVWALRRKFGRSLAPAIVPPTYAKLRGHAWLQEIWSNAMRALQQARLLVFIGYSMPDSDGFMRALIHAAFASRRTKDAPKVCVVDPCKATGERYKKLFGPLGPDKAVRVCRLEFAEAVDQGVFGEILASLD